MSGTRSFDVPARRELRDDKVAIIGIHEKSVLMADEEGRGVRCLCGHLIAHPESFTSPCIQSPQLAVRADAVEMIPNQDGRRGH